MRHLVFLLLSLLAALPCAAQTSAPYVIRYDSWSPEDEKGYGEFVEAIGESKCRFVNECLHDPANPFRASDPPGAVIDSDCADFPYVLRFYYAWKKGLPFSYESAAEPRGSSGD